VTGLASKIGYQPGLTLTGGLQTIEGVLNQACQDYPDTIWYYGNVYAPEDATTPSEWWLDFNSHE